MTLRRDPAPTPKFGSSTSAPSTLMMKVILIRHSSPSSFFFGGNDHSHLKIQFQVVSNCSTDYLGIFWANLVIFNEKRKEKKRKRVIGVFVEWVRSCRCLTCVVCLTPNHSHSICTPSGTDSIVIVTITSYPVYYTA